MASHNTFQTGIYQNTSAGKITDYALFLGGLNVTRQALEQYDPLKTGYGRLFMIRQPRFLETLATEDANLNNKLKMFKHILEYANIGVSGNNNITVTTNSMAGGYTNRSVDMPSIATDDSNELSIKVFEFSGSPIREIIQYWVNGVTDINSGLAHYYGLIGKYDEQNKVGWQVSQANHTAEFIYVSTDQSGRNVEYAALFANCFPKEIKFDQFNYDSGQHSLVEMDVAFTATRYMSPQINDQAKQLLDKYNILMNSLNFHSGYKVEENDKGSNGSYYDSTTGLLKSKNSDEKFVVKG